MARVEGEIVICRPVEEVFDFVADERNEPRYNPRMVRAEKVTPGPVGVGTRFAAQMRGRRPIDMTTEFTDFERPRRLALHARLAAMDVRGALTFEPVVHGTRMRWAWELQPRGALRLFGPLVARIGARQERAIWTALKRLLEADGALDTSTVGRRRERVRWPATAAERAMALPGDELVPRPLVQTTHALTIDAPPACVWPWLVQSGQGRAGFYADSPWWDRCVDRYYRLLAREQAGRPPVGYQVAADDRIVADWQDVHVGDTIADGPPGTAYYVVRHLERDRAFVLSTDTHLPHLLPRRLRRHVHGVVSDSVLLAEPRPGTTRLVRRMRMDCGPGPFRLLAVPVVLVWGDLATERRFLHGVKRRAERAANPRQP